jgi:flagellar biosynthetic protein FliO
MDGALQILRVLVSLAVVFGLLWFLARRMRRGGAGATRRAAQVRVLGKASVGGKAQVVVVEAEGRRMVLGVTEHGVSVLHDAEAPALEAVDPVQAARPAASPAPLAPVVHLPSFESLLSRTQWAAPGAASRATPGTAPTRRGRRVAGR